MKKEKTLIELMEEIYHIWDFVSKEQARSMLKKLLLSNKLNTIEQRRLVLHNLATISIQIEKDKELKDVDMSQAKHYSKALKDMLDSCPDYKNTQANKEKYCKALNNYAVSYKDDITNEELIKIHQYCYDTYKDYDYTQKDKYMEKLISEFNVNILKRLFNNVLMVVEDIMIHNNTTEYYDTLKSFMKDIENVDNSLYKKVLLLVEKQNKQII
jgi:hypothetical protein